MPQDLAKIDEADSDEPDLKYFKIYKKKSMNRFHALYAGSPDLIPGTAQ